jgi:hypothetical protein
MLGSRWNLVALLAGAGLAASLGVGGAIAGADTAPFTTPGPSTFTVPGNVCSVNVSASGAQGGSGTGFITSPPAPGGLGANQTGVVPVTPGEKLGVNVGGAGSNGTGAAGGAGGVNGGGAGGAPGLGVGGAGGGGASDVRQAGGGSGCVPVCQTPTPPARAGSTLGDRVVTAGGGGGGGGNDGNPLLVTRGVGGAGGGQPLSTTVPSSANGNGTQGDVGANPGTAGAGGGGGGTNLSPGTSGTAGAGGAGGANAGTLVSGGGGGGGGGQTGGGGGSGGTFLSGGGGGGGGSSAVGPTVTNATNTPGVQTGNGQVMLGFTPTAPTACAVVAAARLTG